MGSKAKLAQKEIQKYKNLYENAIKEGVDALKAQEKAEKSASSANIERAKMTAKLEARDKEIDELTEKVKNLKAELKTYKNKHTRLLKTHNGLKEELKSVRAELETD